MIFVLHGYKDNAVTRSFTVCLLPDNIARMRTHARTRTHVLRIPLWIFDNPNWIPQLGARRWFSTILALHRPQLSCKIVSPRSPRSKVTNSPSSASPIRGKQSAPNPTCRPFSHSFLRNFPIWCRPKTRENADRDSSEDLETELKIKEE